MFERGKRPLLVTIFCILGFIAVPIVLFGMLVPSVRDVLIQRHGVLYVPITLLTTILALAGLIGYWTMKKWGVYVYAAMVVITIIYYLIAGIPDTFGHIYRLVIVAVGFVYLRKMS